MKEKGADPEDRDEYLAENIFWVPKQARWSFLQGKAKLPEIGKVIDNAMTEIEKENPHLKGRSLWASAKYHVAGRQGREKTQTQTDNLLIANPRRARSRVF